MGIRYHFHMFISLKYLRKEHNFIEFQLYIPNKNEVVSIDNILQNKDATSIVGRLS